jgi:pimeloyl-ACP methyl ester carboxylesterase
MAAIPPLPELKLISVDSERCGLEGRRMSYMEAGAGDPLVLLHGIGSYSGGWRYILAGLSHRYRVVAWNAPGYYLSDNLMAEIPTGPQYVDALAALLDALQIETALLADSSFGSMVAATYAARHPHRVQRLALLGASRGWGWVSAEERSQRLRSREDSIRDGGLGLAEARWAQLLSSRPSDTAVRLTKDVLATTNKRGFMQSVRASLEVDVLSFANAIEAPTLLIVGAEDRVNPPEVSRSIQAAIKGSRLVELAGVGHLPKLEEPEKVIQLLDEHFGKER